MLRWLIDSQALPELMWTMVGLSTIVHAAVLFLLLARLLPRRAPGERWSRELLELCAELGPMLGLLGSVSGLALGALSFGVADAHAGLLAAMRSAFYSTGFGLVLAMVAQCALFLCARRSP